MFNLGNGNKKAYLGEKALDKAYLGDVLVYSGGATENAFIATYNIATDSETLTLPVTKDYQIDWGDGTTTTTGKSHVYANSGVYTVKMFGVVDDFVFNSSGDRLKILTVESWGGFNANSTGNFSGCSNLVSVPNDLNPVSLTLFLRDCVSLVSGCENFDFQEMPITGNVNGCFRGSDSFSSPLNWTNTQNISGWIQFLNSAFSFNNDSLSNLDYSGATDIRNFMFGKSSLNFDFQYYDNLLIKWASGAANGGLDFTKLLFFTTDFGTIQYSSVGAAAHDSLTAQGLTISDGGLRQGAFTATYNIAADGETLTLPVNKDYEIDWGDGVTTTTENSHTYSTLGVYTVKMFGVVDDFRFAFSGDRSKILTVENAGGNVFTTNQMFAGCSNLTSFKSNGLKITSATSVFQGCGNLSYCDLTNANIISPNSNIGTFFFQCGNLTEVIGINSINFENSISIGSFFNSCGSYNQELILNTSNVEVWGFIFRNAFAFNNDSLSNLDYSGATDIRNFMFGKSSLNFDFQYYDNLLIKWASGAANGGLDFTKLTNFTTDFGTIQYSSAGAAAHASLTAQGLIITDGGQNAF